MVRPSSFKRTRTSSQTPPRPLAKPNSKEEHKQVELKSNGENSKEEIKMGINNEELSKTLLKLGEDIGESTDHVDVKNTEKEKLKLKVKPG